MQTTLTKKQRREIYLKAAKDILTNENPWGFCWAARNATSIYDTGFIRLNMDTLFPEYALFRKSILDVWYFKLNERGQLQRGLALLFAAEMCNDN